MIPATENSKYICNMFMDTVTIDGYSLKGLTTSTNVFVKNEPFTIFVGGFVSTSAKKSIEGHIILVHTDQNGNFKNVIASTPKVTAYMEFIYYIPFIDVMITNDIISGDKIRSYAVPTETDVDQTPVWIKGKSHVISEINLTTTSIVSSEEKESLVYGSPSGVVIKGEAFLNKNAYIYDLSGTLIDQFIVTSTRQTRPLAKGTYIVKIGTYTHKIAL